MRNIVSRWFMVGLLIGWALTHSTVFAQPGSGKAAEKTAIEKLRANLDKNITLDYTGGSLVEVLNHFKDKAGIAINVDQMAMMQMPDFGGGVFPGAPMQNIQIKAKDEKASTVLRRLLNGHQHADTTHGLLRAQSKGPSRRAAKCGCELPACKDSHAGPLNQV